MLQQLFGGALGLGAANYGDRSFSQLLVQQLEARNSLPGIFTVKDKDPIQQFTELLKKGLMFLNISQEIEKRYDKMENDLEFSNLRRKEQEQQIKALDERIREANNTALQDCKTYVKWTLKDMPKMETVHCK